MLLPLTLAPSHLSSFSVDGAIFRLLRLNFVSVPSVSLVCSAASGFSAGLGSVSWFSWLGISYGAVSWLPRKCPVASAGSSGQAWQAQDWPRSKMYQDPICFTSRSHTRRMNKWTLPVPTFKGFWQLNKNHRP